MHALVRLRHILAPIAVLGLAGCPVAGPVDPGEEDLSEYPPAAILEFDPEFTGEWQGDVGGVAGSLTIGKLDERSYFGSFVTSDGATEYTMLIQQTWLLTPEGGEVPSNRVIFTWQDGLGSRGKGWLLYGSERGTEERSALTGSFGYGQASSGLGAWTFEPRLE